MTDVMPKTRREARELGVNRYFTGILCKRGHLSERRTSDGSCMECARIYDRNRAPIKTKTDNWKQAQIRHRLKVKVEAINHYGGKCACCGTTRVEFLCIDHINNDGAEHRRKIGRYPMPRWLKQHGYPEGYQVLCWNCNSAKQILGRCTCQDDKR